MIDKLITLSNLSRFKQKLDELYEKIDHASQTYVEKESGKGLSTNDYTTTEKNKLAGIADGAQVNVKPDWNAAAGNAAEILNKPTIPTVGTGVLTITRNSSQIGTFSANASSNESIDIVVPTTAADVDALPILLIMPLIPNLILTTLMKRLPTLPARIPQMKDGMKEVEPLLITPTLKPKILLRHPARLITPDLLM